MPKRSLVQIEEETDPLALCNYLASLVDSTQQFFERIPNPSFHQRVLLWDELTFMHLIITRIEVTMLGLDLEDAKERQDESIKDRRVVQQ